MSINGRNTKILQTLHGHRNDVTTCDITPNYTLITGSSDKTIRIWDWIPGDGYVQRDKSPLIGHKYQVTCVRISPQGCMFASSSVDGTAVLWNIHSLKKLYTMTQINGDAIRVCRFAPDSSILVTAGDNGAICMWDLVHRSLIRTIFEHEGTTQSLAFTPDSQYLVSACSLEMINVWYVQDLVDTTNDKPIGPVAKCDNAHDLGVMCVEFNNIITIDEQNPLIKHYTMATSGNSNEIKIWTLTAVTSPKHKMLTNYCNVTFQYTNSYDGHSSSVTCIRYSSNGAYLISSSLDKFVKIWDRQGNCVANLQGHNRYINCVAISKKCNLVVSGSNDKSIIVWDLNGELSLDTQFYKQHRTSISDDSKNGIPETQLMQVVENDDNEVKLIEKVDEISEGAINCCCFDNDHTLATGSGDKLVRLFRVYDDNTSMEELECSPLEAHTYCVNHVEFSRDGRLLASCSLDGCTNLWDSSTGEKLHSLPHNVLSIRVCRFSSDGRQLITAGDDEKATIWNATTLEEIVTLSGHLDTVTSAAFTPDSNLVVTVSLNEDIRLWTSDTHKNIYTDENGHDYGIQSCDFSQNSDPIPNSSTDVQSYLLATCGNDGLGKLWRIALPHKNETYDYDRIEVKVWRVLHGHGGNVICVRFSPDVGEVVCTTATDRQARIWSVYSSECLYVLDHDSIVTTCSFSRDCACLATGCQDKTLWLWRLPQQLVFRTAVANKIHLRTKAVYDWTKTDILKWLRNIDFVEIEENVKNSSLDGEKLLRMDVDEIVAGLDLNDEQATRLIAELRWLKRDELKMMSMDTDVPHEFLCPITHEIMREPVICADGYSYEKNAIAEWFVSGKYTSPMTNEFLINTEYNFNHELRNAIRQFLDREMNANEV